MKRRSFLQSLAAVVSLPLAPSLSLRPAAAAVPAAVAVPAHARSWAVYMSTLHGQCTPQTLQSMLNISAGEAKSYISQLIADGAIRPNPLMQKSVAELARTTEDSLLDKIKTRLEKKARAGGEGALTREPETALQHLDGETQMAEDISGEPRSDALEQEPELADSRTSDETEVES